MRGIVVTVRMCSNEPRKDTYEINKIKLLC